MDTDLSDLSRAQKKRMADAKKKWAGTLTTNADVIQLLELFTKENVVPLAMAIDDMAKRIRLLEEMVYILAQPWYRRLWHRVRAHFHREENDAHAEVSDAERGGSERVPGDRGQGAGAGERADDPTPH